MTEGRVEAATSLGPVTVETAAGRVVRVQLGRAGDAARPEPLAAGAARALAAWLAGGAWPRGLPLAPTGTPFQKRVWQALLEIPPGRVRTYGDLARSLGTSPRAVGNACRANPIPLLIPCHRVVAADGLGGFAGETTGTWPDLKRWLLRLEGAIDG